MWQPWKHTYVRITRCTVFGKSEQHRVCLFSIGLGLKLLQGASTYLIQIEYRDGETTHYNSMRSSRQYCSIERVSRGSAGCRAPIWPLCRDDFPSEFLRFCVRKRMPMTREVASHWFWSEKRGGFATCPMGLFRKKMAGQNRIKRCRFAQKTTPFPPNPHVLTLKEGKNERKSAGWLCSLLNAIFCPFG